MSVTLNNISKSYNGKVVINDISLEFRSGETTVLIGPSGCGKSTLIRIITGLVKPDSGSVYFDTSELSPVNLITIRRNIGYVIQEGGLFPHLTASGNITLLPKHIGWTKERIAERQTELVNLMNFPVDALERYPAELSGGQKQRVSLMRALFLDPQFLILDEPLGALDPMIRFELQNELKRIFIQLKKTVIMVTHDLHEAVYFGDQVVLLKDGRIVQKGKIHDMAAEPKDQYVTDFINAQRGELK